MADPTLPLDAFISFSTEDREAVEPIHRKLVAAGLRTFYAPVDLAKGVGFPTTLGDRLEASRALLLFVTPSSAQSFWVSQEWQTFLTKMSVDPTRRLVPVLLPGAGTENIPTILRPQNAVDLSQYDLTDPLRREQATYQLLVELGFVPTSDEELVPIPFVVCAMTAEEFQALDSGSVFEQVNLPFTKSDRSDYLQLKEFLATHGGVDLAACYGTGRDDWRPPIAPQPIRRTIEEIVDFHNRSPTHGQPIRAQFLSEEFSHPDAGERGKTWSRLAQQKGWVMVIDSVSMSHPGVRQTVVQSATVNSATLVVVPPISPRNLPMFAGLDDLEKRIGTQLLLAFRRFETDLDLLSEFGVGDYRSLRRWLFAILPEAAKRVLGQRPDQEQAARLSQQLAQEQGQPGGIGQAIFRGVSR